MATIPKPGPVMAAIPELHPVMAAIPESRPIMAGLPEPPELTQCPELSPVLAPALEICLFCLDHSGHL